jgi:AbrB family transcriptional regulator, transcriptional pleiotropic regulator of transition state genes
MKATGMVRKMDPLGRVVLPKELRKSLNIQTDNALEIFIDGDKLVFRKYTPGYIFCGETHHFSTFQGKRICPQCRDAIKQST